MGIKSRHRFRCEHASAKPKTYYSWICCRNRRDNKISDKLEEKRKKKKLDMLIANKVPESFNSENIEVNLYKKINLFGSAKEQKTTLLK